MGDGPVLPGGMPSTEVELFGGYRPVELSKHIGSWTGIDGVGSMIWGSGFTSVVEFRAKQSS